MRTFLSGRRLFLHFLMLAAALSAGAGSTALGMCGPFTDVAGDAFCPFVLEIFYLGITTGTTPTTTVTTGFGSLAGALWDGANIWVTDRAPGTLLKLNSSGAVLQTVTVGSNPQFAVFDGTNIWVPNFDSASVSVVRASTGAVLATLTNNGLIFSSEPQCAAFDGQRILVTNYTASAVHLWKAADLTAIGSFSTGHGTNPYGAASDGVNFWIALNGVAKLARF